MGKGTKIQWAHHSWSPWIGCTKVSQGCRFCYAETLMTRRPRWANSWGPEGERVRTSESYWKKPYRWNRKAKEKGIRYRVFPSLCDPFEEHPSIKASWALEFYQLIRRTPHLDWLLLTKRPENAKRCTPPHWWTNWPKNLWVGTSVEDQEAANERIPELLKIPAPIRFLSCEPLLKPIDIDEAMYGSDERGMNAFGFTDGVGHEAMLQWIIVGGESGPNARPMDLAWARDIIRQCRTAEVPVFMKQLGARPMLGPGDTFKLNPIQITDPKGGDPSEWPEDLRIREFPESPLEEIQPSLL